MKLKKFIYKLQEIAMKHGANAQVIMADNILVVDPVYAEDYPKHRKAVVITDQE